MSQIRIIGEFAAEPIKEKELPGISGEAVGIALA